MSIRDSTPSLPETSENFLKLYEINFLEENFAGEKERGRKFDLPPFDWNSICGRVLPSRTPSAQLFHRHFRSRGLVTPRPMLIPARSSPFDRLFRASPNGFNKISLRFYLSYPTSFPPLPVPQFSLSLSLFLYLADFRFTVRPRWRSFISRSLREVRRVTILLHRGNRTGTLTLLVGSSSCSFHHRVFPPFRPHVRHQSRPLLDSSAAFSPVCWRLRVQRLIHDEESRVVWWESLSLCNPL